MQTKSHQLKITIGGFFLFGLDRFLKHLSLNVFTDKFLITNGFGWNPFKNNGIAFSLPVPNYLTVAVSIPILVLILYFLFQDYKEQKDRVLIGLTALFFGALSNFLDRIFYHATIDYWLIGSGVINLADVLIVASFTFLFKRRNNNPIL